MLIERSDQDNCPYCSMRFEIAAVRFKFFGACTAVFVCQNCGLTRAESDSTPSIAKRIFAYFTRHQHRAHQPGAAPTKPFSLPDENVLKQAARYQ
jgi:hypothetical protein